MKDFMKKLIEKSSNFINQQWKKDKKRFTIICLVITVILLLSILSITLSALRTKNAQPQQQTVSTSALDVAIEINDLITVEYPYSAIVAVPDDATEKKDKIKFYLAYDGIVYARFDGNKLEKDIDTEEKQLIITLPNIELVPVIEEASIQYIFEDEKYHTEKVSFEMIQLCKDDLLERAKNDTDIISIARQNAISIIKEKTQSLVNAANPEYTVEVK